MSKVTHPSVEFPEGPYGMPPMNEKEEQFIKEFEKQMKQEKRKDKVD